MVEDIDDIMGRKEIYTSVDTINMDNIREVLTASFKLHLENSQETEFLVDYYKGKHPEILDRVKEVREDVDNKVILNYPMSVTRDIVGYILGKPITFIQKKGTYRDEVQYVNSILSYIGKAKIDKDVLEDAVISGIGYYGVFPEKDEDSPLSLHRLDPSSTFVVKSVKLGNKPMMAVSYYTENIEDELGKKIDVFTVYTETNEYIIRNLHPSIDFTSAEIVEKNNSLGGLLPIIEMPINKWLLGLWEACISIFDSLDIIASDSVNDIVQFVNSLLVISGVEVDEEAYQKIKQDKLINLIIPPNSGIDADVKYIAQQLDSSSVKDLREYLETAYRIIIGVPDRKTKSSSGGDTGEAVSLRDGWLDIDLVASNCEDYIIEANRELLKVVLYILKINKKVPNLKAIDINIKFNRNKTVNLQTKTTAFSTLDSTNKFDPADILEIVDLTTDVQDVIARGEKYQEKKIKELQELQGNQNDTTDEENNKENNNKVSTQE